MGEGDSRRKLQICLRGWPGKGLSFRLRLRKDVGLAEGKQKGQGHGGPEGLKESAGLSGGSFKREVWKFREGVDGAENS